MKILRFLFPLALVTQSYAASPISFEKGDRVTFVGGTFVERMARFGYLETALTLALHDKKLTFRNLGWSADTVRGESRGYDKPQSGYANLLANVRKAEPTLLFLAYGAAESWEAETQKFATDYQRLLDELKPLGARMVLVSPILQENWGKPMPDPTKHNADLRAHAASIRELAEKVQSVCDVKRPLEYQSRRAWDSVNRRCADITRARKVLGYEPTISLEQGLRLTHRWFRDRGIVNRPIR